MTTLTAILAPELAAHLAGADAPAWVPTPGDLAVNRMPLPDGTTWDLGVRVLELEGPYGVKVREVGLDVVGAEPYYANPALLFPAI